MTDSERYTIISADGHAGLSCEEYRPYLDPKYTAEFDAFLAQLDKVTADLKEKGPTADEFERARKPEFDSLERAVETNGFWSSFLAGAQADERRLELIRQARPKLERVTVADVQRVAQKYLTDAKAWKLVVTPKP